MSHNVHDFHWQSNGLIGTPIIIIINYYYNGVIEIKHLNFFLVSVVPLPSFTFRQIFMRKGTNPTHSACEDDGLRRVQKYWGKCCTLQWVLTSND